MKQFLRLFVSFRSDLPAVHWLGGSNLIGRKASDCPCEAIPFVWEDVVFRLASRHPLVVGSYKTLCRSLSPRNQLKAVHASLRQRPLPVVQRFVRGIQKSSDCIRVFRITGNPHAHREQWLLWFRFEQFTNSSCTNEASDFCATGSSL